MLVFAAVSGASSRKKVFELLDKQKENYEKEIQIIKETTEEADKKKTEIFTEHIKEIEKIESKLSSFFGTRIKTNGNNKKGQIIIPYKSTNDLNRILELLDII